MEDTEYKCFSKTPSGRYTLLVHPSGVPIETAPKLLLATGAEGSLLVELSLRVDGFIKHTVCFPTSMGKYSGGRTMANLLVEVGSALEYMQTVCRLTDDSLRCGIASFPDWPTEAYTLPPRHSTFRETSRILGPVVCGYYSG